MTENLTPAQLPAPSTNARKGFIAYGSPTRVAVPTASGNTEPMTVRPQVFVRYIHDIAVKDVKRGGRNGTADTVAVEFDPESIGYTEKVTGYLDSDDPIADYLEQKLSDGATVSVGIEIARRTKQKSTKESISALPHINALRGADHPDGTGTGQQMMGSSGENTSKAIALVDGQRARKVTSDPTEWATLVNNAAGDLPPEGWTYYSPGDDWKQISTIVAADPAPSNSQGEAHLADPDTLAALVEQAVTKALAQNVQSHGGAVNGRPLGRRFNEGKPWDVRTNDGRINLGGYGVLNEGYTFRWSHSYLTEHTDKVTDDNVWALASAVLSIADRVQTAAYDDNIRADRTTNSHTEASRWVQWTISTVHPYDPDADITSWADNVTAAAAEHFARCGNRLDEFLQQRATQESQQKPEPQATDAATNDGPNPTVQALLNAAEKAWLNVETIKTLGVQLSSRQDLNVTVSVTHHDDGTVSLTPSTEEGARVLRDVLFDQYTALNDARPAGHTQPPSPTPTPTVDDGLPAEYPDDVATTLNLIGAVTTRQDAEKAYEHAKAANQLGTQVAAKVADDGTVTFGPLGADGYDTRTVANVLDFMTRQIEAAADGPTATTHTDTSNGNDSAQQVVDEIVRKKADETLTVDHIDEAITALRKAGRSSDTVTVNNTQGPATSYLTFLRKASMAGAPA